MTICPWCGYDNPEGAEICEECEARLRSEDEIGVRSVKCPVCAKGMSSGFLMLSTNSLANLSWTTKPSILGLKSEPITSWSLLAKNLKAFRCEHCQVISFQY